MALTKNMSTPSSAPGPFDIAMQQGLHASRGNDASGALTAWAHAAALDPSSALPHLLIGAELAQAGQSIEAEDAYARAVALAPGFEAARFQLGLLQFTMGRLALANVTWGPLCAAEGTGPFRLFVKAFAALAHEELAEAASLFEFGMAANTTNEPLNRDIARVLVTIQSRRLPDSAAAIPDSPSTPETDGHLLLAAYRQQGLSH